MIWNDRGFDSCTKLCYKGLHGNTVLHSARTVLLLTWHLPATHPLQSLHVTAGVLRQVHGNEKQQREESKAVDINKGLQTPTRVAQAAPASGRKQLTPDKKLTRAK